MHDQKLEFSALNVVPFILRITATAVRPLKWKQKGASEIRV
jgi:hypothetical protein